jgi:GDP-L-fucose synthase
LINAAVELKINKLINLGSSCMYPKDSIEALREEDILTSVLEPTNEGYAIAKIGIAKLCEYANKEYGFNYKTLIPCNLYGKYDDFSPKKSHMVPAVIRKMYEAITKKKAIS